MKRTFLASLLSAALVFTPITVTPAQADEDVAKVLAGIAFFAILNEISKDNRDKRRAAPVTRRVDPHPAPTTRRIYPRHEPRVKRHSKVAPQECLRQQWTHRGTRHVYGARCLQRKARVAPPVACQRQANTNNGPRRFYTKRCLRNHGWRA
jgi:hypothetical protein